MPPCKAYPEHDDFQVALPLGDPSCSPVWTAVVQQLEIGERARFTLSRKAWRTYVRTNHCK